MMKPHFVSETWSKIVKDLNRALESPSDEYPNTRWISGPALRRLLVRIRDSVGAPKNFSGQALLDSLVACGMVKELYILPALPNRPAFTAYGLEVGGEPSISPMELLVATQPDFRKTAICYFTAIQYHDLTTQVAPHHHIALLKEYPARIGVSEPTDRIPSMGSRLFDFEGTPYFLTLRDRSLVQGVQTVRMATHFLARVTTLEQTLLDTLHRPWSCGGPAVVFEAWARGVSRLDETRLAQYLLAIPNSELPRRVGFLLEQQDHEVSDPELRRQLREAQSKAGSLTVPPVPLLPQVPAQTLCTEWGLYL